MNNRYVITDYGVEPNSSRLQTEAIQTVFDLCKAKGGTVVVPCGEFRTGGLQMWSDTTLYLESGAQLIGSDYSEDYAVFPVPDGVELRTDMELITQYYENKPWDTYRRAIISVYGGKNISIIGEKGSLIDGNDCCDPLGEEGYRGPHGIFITNVQNLRLEGYEIANCGNFMHQIDNCQNINIKNVKCTAGSDGVHLHHCNNILIEDCVFHTGDDCIAGINMSNLTVRRCDLNTSCDIFRAGAKNVLVEDTKMWGPGIYPHRMTVVQNRGTELVRDRSNTLPQSEGRHNLINVWVHFASTNFPSKEPYDNVVFRNCKIENADHFLEYIADHPPLQKGAYLTGMTLENIEFTGLLAPSITRASAENPLTITLENVTVSSRNHDGIKAFDGNDKNVIIIEKQGENYGI